MLLKRLLLAIAIIGSPAFADCRRPLIFFDLGGTLVDTKTHDFAKVYYINGANQYIQALKKEGYHMGLLVNYPDSDGKTEEGKKAHLKKFIASKWFVVEEGDPTGFGWDDFDLGLHVPPTDAERKPKPFLFEKAVKIAKAAGCKVIFEGDDLPEVKAARTAGMYAFHVGKGEDYFLPIDAIDDFVKGDVPR